MWAYLEQYHRETGGDVLAIPHNANWSDGKMFMPIDFKSNAIDDDYAQRRQRWEPLFEVTQHKETSEAHPLLSPRDEFADFEIWNKRPWDKSENNGNSIDSSKKQYEYARSALKLGLQQQTRIGVNPFKFGLIGSADSHISLSDAEENNFWPTIDDSGLRLKISAEFGASGYAAVWATDNTRKAHL